MNNNPIMFGSSDCPACMAQFKILSDKFGKSKNANVTYYDLKKYPPPEFILSKSGDYSMPTWALPDGRGNYKIHKGIINKELDTLLTKPRNAIGSRKNKFGDVVPEINTLAKYGKNFDDYRGFKVPNSFMNEQTDKWGKGDNVLVSGTMGRELGPGNTDKVYSENYYSGIRMGGPPGGDYGTLLFNNRNANIVTNQSAATMETGLIYDTPNSQQIVGFGNRRKKNNFGLDTGPAYGSQYLMQKDTLDRMYVGGGQKEAPRPKYVNNKNIWIGDSVPYKPIKSVSEFGKKNKQVLGPGSTIIIKNNKIKIKGPTKN